MCYIDIKTIFIWLNLTIFLSAILRRLFYIFAFCIYLRGCFFFFNFIFFLEYIIMMADEDLVLEDQLLDHLDDANGESELLNEVISPQQ